MATLKTTAATIKVCIFHRTLPSGEIEIFQKPLTEREAGVFNIAHLGFVRSDLNLIIDAATLTPVICAEVS